VGTACLASIGGASFLLVVLYLKLTSLLILLLEDRGFEEIHKQREGREARSVDARLRC